MERKDTDIPADAPTVFEPAKHVAYLVKWNESKDELEYIATEYLRMSGLYWCITALHILNEPDKLSKEDILAFVDECFDEESGGFSASQENDPHLLYTLSAIQILCMYDSMQEKYAEGVVRFVQSLANEDGSFKGDRWGEVDTRFSFCALASLALVGRLDAVDTALAADYVLSCLNFDGGFGVGPESETHAGQIYCCVSALAVTNDLHRIDRRKLGFWLSRRQLPRSGGFNGRPEKLPDVCYSWWVLSSLLTLDCQRWIDQTRLRTFILACQDTQTGGFADRPGDMPDPFHTLFGVAALSMLGDTSLANINSVYCMPQDVVDRVFAQQQKPVEL